MSEEIEIIPDYEIGDKVKVSSENDNEGYDDFRDEILVVTYVALSREDHLGYDEGVGQALYELETLDGKPIGLSLYDYELEST